MREKEKIEIHRKIADRYEAYCTELGIEPDDRTTTMMDLEAVSKAFPDFGWQELLDADNWNFCHDIGGIKRHIDRTKRVFTDNDVEDLLTENFIPRFAYAGKAVAV